MTPTCPTCKTPPRSGRDIPWLCDKHGPQLIPIEVGASPPPTASEQWVAWLEALYAANVEQGVPDGVMGSLARTGRATFDCEYDAVMARAEALWRAKMEGKP